MKTEALDYLELQSLARKNLEKLKKDNTKGYHLDRRTENIAYLFALESGLRVSDLLNIKHSDIKNDTDLMMYTFTTKIRKTKNTHTGILSHDLYQYLIEFKDVIRNSKGKANDLIFYNYNNGKPYTRQWLYKRIKIIGKKLDIDHCGVHSIRKASAINVLNKTGSLSLAQYHLTHKRATTTDNYLNVSKKTALEQLAKIF